MFNVAVAQSGGPTAAINSSLAGVFSGASGCRDIDGVYGMLNGIEGAIEGNYVDLSKLLTSRYDIDLLKRTPSTILGSCRYKLKDYREDSSDYEMIAETFSRLEIKAFFYIGGNDSMDTVSKLSRFASQVGSDIRFVGIPKTIDNDLILTDHTPGFASAAKYVASTVREIVLDSSVYHQKSVTIVELMGRHTGWLTAASVLARRQKDDNPALIYLPERPFLLEQFARDVDRELTRRRSVVVCVSEGIKDPEGVFLCEYDEERLAACLGREAVIADPFPRKEAMLDHFGHKMLTGCGKILERFVRERFGVKVRSAELNVSQRCCGMLASLTDIEEAEKAGRTGVRYAVEGQTGILTALVRRTAEASYQLDFCAVDVNKVCNQEKNVPLSWISGEGNDVTEEYLDYVLPLIQGSAAIPMRNGLPDYLYRRKKFSD